MRHLIDKLQSIGIKRRAIYSFLCFMVESKPLGESTYEMLRTLNLALSDSSYLSKAYFSLTTSIEPTLVAIIKHDGKVKKFNDFYLSKQSSPVSDSLRDDINSASKAKKIYKPKGASLFRYYLEFVESEKIIEESFRKHVYNARNDALHAGAIVRYSGGIGGYIVDVLKMLVMFFNLKREETFIDHVWSWSVVAVAQISYEINSILDTTYRAAAVLGEFGLMALSFFKLLFTSVKLSLYTMVSVIASLIVMAFTTTSAMGYFGESFDKATYEQICSMAEVERAHLHLERADIANEMRYSSKYSNTAERMHKRTEEISKLLQESGKCPNLLICLFPGFHNSSFVQKLDDKLDKMNASKVNTNREYQFDGRLSLKRDNPPAFELFSNYYYCDYIYLNNLKRSPKMREAEMSKLIGLCQAIKNDANIDVCVAYNYDKPLDCKVAEDIKTLFAQQGISSKRVKITNIAFKNQPKLFIRLNNKYNNTYSDLSLSSTSVDSKPLPVATKKNITKSTNKSSRKSKQRR